MTDAPYPKDENLRLVLSTDQEQWLGLRIRECKTFIWAMAILLTVSTSWIALFASGTIVWGGKPDCFSFVGNAPDQQEMREQFLKEGLKPCPPEGTTDENTNWDDVQDMATPFAAIVILVSFLFLLRNLFLLRRYKGYLTDHRAFLKKYHRL
ncbi:MAG: hypothetical protein ACTSV1_10140 [Alphaproteobacteria bacterium]